MLSWILSYFSLSSKATIALLNVLMPVVVDRSILWKNRLKLEASIYNFLFFINVRVLLLHFSLAFPFCSSRFSLPSCILGFLIICAKFNNVFLFSLRRTGTLRAHSCCFAIVNETYECYEARSVIRLFQMNKFFSHHFLCFKLEIFDPRNSCNPIRFTTLPNECVNDCRYNPVLCPNKLIYRRQITAWQSLLF